jgi:hypothetical protein
MNTSGPGPSSATASRLVVCSAMRCSVGTTSLSTSSWRDTIRSEV